MAEISGILSLDKFVRKMLVKMARTQDDYLRYLMIAQDGLRHLFMHKLGYITNTRLTVDTDTNTADFPADYVGYVSLSVPDDGRMWTLTRDDSLIATTTTVDESETLDFNYGEGVDLDEELIPLGYGARGGFSDTYFSVDLKQRRFIIAGIIPAFIILRYVSSGINTDAETYIPLEAEESLESYVRWKCSEYEEQPRPIITEKKKAFESAVRRMNRLHAPTLFEIKDAIYATSNQSLKR